jgi:hypothetical protein
MRKSAFIQLCLWITIASVVTALGIRLYRNPNEAIGGDTFAIISPIFFGMAAKNGIRFGRAAVVVALIGVVFAVGGVWAAFHMKLG